MKLVLCGYMGSGKTLIGRLLEKKHPVDFIDLDEQIEAFENQSIAKIFKEHGEIGFRKMETTVLKTCLQSENNIVLALGGGTPCYGNNLDLIKKNPETVSVYLKTNLDELTARLFPERKNRPLISGIEKKGKLKDYIRKHLFERRFYYAQSDVVIETSGRSPEEIVERVAAILK